MRNILIIITLISSIYSANNLASEPSPYLQQHKDNPVNWYPWGKEAFEKAKKEKKLIFLSIGYSTCHWCHVMAKESFSDKEVAQLLNRDYIAIKVDKEQYPQIDEYYQGIYQIFNRRGGGWPLTVIMTPNKKPIFAATYIPKYTRGEFKGLMDILPFFTKLDKKELESEGKRVLKIYSNYLNSSKSKAKISKNILTSALSGYKASYDTLYKGFGGAPKFPQASKLNNLLTIYELSGSKSSLEMVTQALDAMAKSGLYDQIEGGFFRYSVDRKWSIPHFEKMLYTNAQLIEVYTKAYNLTGKKLYKKVVKKSISNINKYFKIDSLYKSASNADSKNFDNKEEEGFYFIYDYNKAFDYISKKGVDKKSVKQNLHYLSIDDSDNFNGVSSHAQINSLIKPDNNLPKVVNALREIREKKEYPFIDYKINTAWNALYINALIKAGAIDRQYSKEGIKSLNALVKKMYRDGVLYHQSMPSKVATQKAFLEDYAFVADALFSAYQVTLNKKYFKLYKTILLDAKDRFYKNSQWYISQDKFKIVASLDDRSYKSSLAILLKNLYILSVIDADIKLQSLVKKTLHSYGDIINNSAAHMPSALDLALMIQRDVIIFKANKESLQNEKLDINYPFLYKYSIDKNDIYLACNKSSCFSFSKNIKRVKEDILLKIKLKPNKH